MPSNNIIVMNRGDTYEFTLSINDENSLDGRYRLKDEDALYFGIMDVRQPFENALVRKKYTALDCDAQGNIVISIEPSDTIDLLPGKYYYAVKLHQLTDDAVEYIDKVITVINNTKFIICE